MFKKIILNAVGVVFGVVATLYMADWFMEILFTHPMYMGM
ncbi:hypothetical protein PP742_gp71 [Alcaligenes phage vB_Af_QDWS595]|uniref:Uncharacterized protein n=1 Tax=Alcaligenes phage vB_Af_QDWS595 TaxID=2877946 RepID=A0AAE9BZJ1_9CAUD|nr:hypothetical protein PP742_gp71 [Alcaligenes phage vB_Af_QDWS595]UCR75555.1 hypothetical protein vBAfaPQDWS595_71 [Alcaligenes phage vB_Af_QDWS595]